MKNNFIRQLIVNMFGTLGYFACLLLWAWTAILYLPMLFSNEQFKQYILPPVTEEVTSPIVSSSPSPLTLIFALATTVVILVITVIVLIRVPVTIAKTGRTITTKAADSAVPLIVRGKPLKNKEKRKLTSRLIFAIKLLLVILPTAALSLSSSVEFALSFDLVILVAQFLAATAIAWFCLQYLAARILSIGFDKLV